MIRRPDSRTIGAMKVHEYQARELLAEAGVPVPPAQVVETAEAAAGSYAPATQNRRGKLIRQKVERIYVRLG